jgi:hypothetical protein
VAQLKTISLRSKQSFHSKALRRTSPPRERVTTFQGLRYQGNILFGCLAHREVIESRDPIVVDCDRFFQKAATILRQASPSRQTH